MTWFYTPKLVQLQFKQERKQTMPTYKQPQKVKSPVVGEEANSKYLRDTAVIVGNTRSQEYAPTKTSGIKIRGTGAATKGTMARGPMA
jgi:hypothetical protein